MCGPRPTQVLQLRFRTTRQSRVQGERLDCRSEPQAKNLNVRAVSDSGSSASLQNDTEPPAERATLGKKGNPNDENSRTEPRGPLHLEARPLRRVLPEGPRLRGDRPPRRLRRIPPGPR